MDVRTIVVRKADLPIALVLEDGGQVRVMELAPAGRDKLGACLREASQLLKDAVMRLRRR